MLVFNEGIYIPDDPLMRSFSYSLDASLMRSSSYSLDASYGEQFLTLLLMVLIRKFFYTRDTSFREEFHVHSSC